MYSRLYSTTKVAASETLMGTTGAVGEFIEDPRASIINKDAHGIIHIFSGRGEFLIHTAKLECDFGWCMIHYFQVNQQNIFIMCFLCGAILLLLWAWPCEKAKRSRIRVVQLAAASAWPSRAESATGGAQTQVHIPSGTLLPARITLREGRTLWKAAYRNLDYQGGSWRCDLCDLDRVCFQPGIPCTLHM